METMTDIPTDWRYTPEKMQVRASALNTLLERFGRELDPSGQPKYSNRSIYECAHDWVSQGNMITHGIIKYYEVYYADEGYTSVNQGSS